MFPFAQKSTWFSPADSNRGFFKLFAGIYQNLAAISPPNMEYNFIVAKPTPF